MKLFDTLLVILCIFYIGLIMFTNRALYFSKFDEPYWKDKYEHSQWKLPLSVRTIGDDGLYLYEGYRLMHGGDPTLLNAEVPPLGKYLIGASIQIFGNGYWYGLITTLGLVLLVYLLSKSMIASAIVLFDPLITNQFTLTMLDSLHALFLLLTIYFAKKIHKHRFYAVAAGLTLGFFAETKAPLYVPLLAALLFPLYKKHFFSFFAAASIGYMLPYIPYFIAHPNVIDWLKIQKWIISFYTQSNLLPSYGSAITSFFGYQQNIFNKTWTMVPEFSFFWPILLVGGLYGLLTRHKVLFAVSVVFLVFQSFLPFWTRYLLLVLPLLAIGIENILPKKLLIFCTILFIGMQFAKSYTILFPSHENLKNQFLYEWQYGFFSDMYENVDNKTKKQFTREAFTRFGLTAFADAQIEAVQIDPNTTITYITRELGSFTHNSAMNFVKEQGRWHVQWEWGNLFPNFSPEYTLETTIIPARRGAIVASDKKPISYDFESILIWITPSNIVKNQEEQLFLLLEAISDKKILAVQFHQRAVGNSLGNRPIPMLTPMRPLTTEEKNTLLRFSGVSITPHVARFIGSTAIQEIGTIKNDAYVECCSLIYNTTAYNGDSGVEKTKNALLKGTNGGTLIMRDTQGNTIHTLISLQKIDGQDVQP